MTNTPAHENIIVGVHGYFADAMRVEQTHNTLLRDLLWTIYVNRSTWYKEGGSDPQRHIAKRLRKSAWERPGLADQTSGLQVKILLFIKLVNNDNVNHQKLSKPFPSATDTVQDHILNAV
jgi:hypothetical protein